MQGAGRMPRCLAGCGPVTPETEGERGSPKRFLLGLESVVERASRTGDWELARKAFGAGLADARTRRGTLCALADIVMARLFVLREPEARLRRFLVEDLGVASEMVEPLERLAAGAAKAALGVSRSEMPLDEASEGLARDHGADPETARALVETGLRFLRRHAPSWRLFGFAIASLAGHPYVAVPVSVALGAALWLWTSAGPWLAALAGLAALAALTVARVAAGVSLRGAAEGRRGLPPPGAR